MQHPHLILIAGCNGAGKSTYSASLVKEVVPFDYDKRYFEIYNSLRDSEFREQFALNQATEELNQKIKKSFLEKKSFCFETNLHVFPINWIREAKQKGFMIDLYFFCLESIEQAKQRVFTRTKNNGHFVDDSTIEYKWKEGYKNFNLFFLEFDKIIVIDNSKNNLPAVLFEMKKNTENDYEILIPSANLPKYIQNRLPAIFDIL